VEGGESPIHSLPLLCLGADRLKEKWECRGGGVPHPLFLLPVRERTKRKEKGGAEEGESPISSLPLLCRGTKGVTEKGEGGGGRVPHLLSPAPLSGDEGCEREGRRRRGESPPFSLFLFFAGGRKG